MSWYDVACRLANAFPRLATSRDALPRLAMPRDAAPSPQVGYCQGMAFCAGILLMYVPEEAAFHLLCQIMDAKGANMRALFLPGFEELKLTLARMDVLVAKRAPHVIQHLGEGFRDSGCRVMQRRGACCVPDMCDVSPRLVTSTPHCTRPQLSITSNFHQPPLDTAPPRPFVTIRNPPFISPQRTRASPQFSTPPSGSSPPSATPSPRASLHACSTWSCRSAAVPCSCVRPRRCCCTRGTRWSRCGGSRPL